MESKAFLGNRTKWEIYGDFIDILSENNNSSHLLLKAGISFKQRTRYLRRMVSEGLLKRLEGQEERYEVTENGRKFRYNLDGLLSLLR